MESAAGAGVESAAGAGVESEGKRECKSEQMEYAPGGCAIAQKKARRVSARARRRARLKAQRKAQRKKAREDAEVKAREDAKVKAGKEEAREAAPWREFERARAEVARVRHLPPLPPVVWGTIKGYLLQACIGGCGRVVQEPPRCYYCSQWFKENTCGDCEHHGSGCPTCDRCDDCDDCEEHYRDRHDCGTDDRGYRTTYAPACTRRTCRPGKYVTDTDGHNGRLLYHCTECAAETSDDDDGE